MRHSLALTAALAHMKRGWPVFPVSIEKRPLTPHGLLDATLDIEQIQGWWTRWPHALVAIATGKISGVVGLDVDVRDGGSGLDSLEILGISMHPVTPTAHSPSGGFHCLFAWPGSEIKNSTGVIGRFLDVRGDRGSLILPPGPGRYWDPHLGLNTPLAPMPEWMVERATEQTVVQPYRPAKRPLLSRYAEVALDRAVEAITKARAGEQHTTLNREAYGVAQLVAGGAVPAGLALEALQWAARRMPSFDARRPWRTPELERQMQAAFLDGLTRPRHLPR